MGNGRASRTPKSPKSGRILGGVGIALIAIVAIGVIFVVVNRPGAVPVTTASPGQAPSSSQPPTITTGRADASQTPIENEHSQEPEDSEPEESEEPKDSPSPTPTPEPSDEQPPPKITKANLPEAADLAWRDSGEWSALSGSDDFGDQPPSVCLPSVTVLANPSTMLRRDYALSDVGNATALVVDYATNEEAEQAYAELGRDVRDCPTTLRQQGYVQPSPVAVKPVPLPEGIVAEHLRLEYVPQDGEKTTESIGLIRAGNRVLMLSMVTPAADTSWSKNSAGETQDHPMLRTLPPAAGRLISSVESP